MAWAGCDNQAAAVRPGERQTALGLGWEEARDWEQGWTWEVTEIPHSILIPVRGRGSVSEQATSASPWSWALSICMLN